MTLTTKRAQLEQSLATLPGALVAFSGGVDSTALLWAARVALGCARVLAVTADSPSYPAAEKAEAMALARAFGVEHRILSTDELARAGYRENGADRCYYCKTELFEQVARAIRACDLPDWPVLYGAITDDLGDHRPGAQAAKEHDVLAPLAAAGMDKLDVRAYSREEGLPTADKPSFACLSSRVPYGTPIDGELLGRLEAAEDHLRSRGFRQFRVRHHGATCRIELAPADIARAAGDERAGIVERLKQLGWAYVALDLEGFRSGSMNETLRV